MTPSQKRKEKKKSTPKEPKSNIPIQGLQPPAHRFLIALLQADTHQTCSQNSVTFWCRAALWDLSKPPSYPRENVVKWLERDEEVKEECAGLDGEGEAEEIRQLAGERGVKV